MKLVKKNTFSKVTFQFTFIFLYFTIFTIPKETLERNQISEANEKSFKISNKESNTNTIIAGRDAKLYPFSTKLTNSNSGNVGTLKHHRVSCPGSAALSGFHLWGKFRLISNKIAIEFSCLSHKAIEYSGKETIKISNVEVVKNKKSALNELGNLIVKCPNNSLIKNFVLKEIGKNIYYEFSCIKSAIEKCRMKTTPYKYVRAGFLGFKSISQLDQFKIKAAEGYGIQMFRGMSRGNRLKYLYSECKLKKEGVKNKKTGSKIAQRKASKAKGMQNTSSKIRNSKPNNKTNNSNVKKTKKKGEISTANKKGKGTKIVSRTVHKSKANKKGKGTKIVSRTVHKSKASKKGKSTKIVSRTAQKSKANKKGKSTKIFSRTAHKSKANKKGKSTKIKIKGKRNIKILSSAADDYSMSALGNRFCQKHCEVKLNSDPQKCFEDGINNCNRCKSRQPVKTVKIKAINKLCNDACSQGPNTNICVFYPYKLLITRQNYDKNQLKKMAK